MKCEELLPIEKSINLTYNYNVKVRRKVIKLENDKF